APCQVFGVNPPRHDEVRRLLALDEQAVLLRTLAGDSFHGVKFPGTLLEIAKVVNRPLNVVRMRRLGGLPIDKITPPRRYPVRTRAAPDAELLIPPEDRLLRLPVAKRMASDGIGQQNIAHGADKLSLFR